MSEAIILSVGDELLAGRITDTNATYASSWLVARGFRVIERRTIPDREDAIADAVKLAWQRVPVVIVGGGLGPTLDDLTRTGLARAFDVPLARDAHVEAGLREFARERGREVRPADLRQAEVPEGFLALRNPVGTAPALLRVEGTRLLLALPGVPHEYKSLLDLYLAPRLAEHPDRGQAPVSASVTVCGVPESEIGQRIEDLMRRGRDPEVGSYPSGGPVTLVATSRHPSRDEAARLAAADVDEIRRRFPAAALPGEHRTPASALIEAATRRGVTVGIAESMTGGLVSTLLVEVPGASAVLKGSLVTYLRETKAALLGIPPLALAGADVVSEATARAMARGARLSLGSDVAVGLTGVAGPGAADGVKEGTVWIAVEDRAGSEARRYQFLGGRNQIRQLAASAAIELMRRRVSELPLSGP